MQKIDDSKSLYSISILASSSPEGVYEYNKLLTNKRILSIEKYLISNYPFINNVNINTTQIDENWDGLIDLVNNDSDIPYKEKVLDILNSDINSATKEWRLKQISNGVSWRYIQKNFLKYLRSARASISFYKYVPVLVEPELVIIYE